VPRILYLDQNHWIEIARGVKHPNEYPEVYAVAELLVQQVRAGQLIVPLSATNIYETHKKNEPRQRSDLALVQTDISQGRVYRGRHALLREQIVDYLYEIFSIDHPIRPKYWFLSDLHFESAADYDPSVYGFAIPERILSSMRADPPRALYHYLTELDEASRTAAVRNFTAGSNGLISRLEQLRSLVAGQPIAMRRQVYGARLLIENLDYIFSLARELDLPLTSANDLGKARIRAITTQIPMFDIERELVIRAESENRATDENDLRDIAALCCVIKYADIVVAEKPFVNRARQGNLDNRYNVRLLTAVTDITPELFS
jgi:hypothetical protein